MASHLCAVAGHACLQSHQKQTAALQQVNVMRAPARHTTQLRAELVRRFRKTVLSRRSCGAVVFVDTVRVHRQKLAGFHPFVVEAEQV